MMPKRIQVEQIFNNGKKEDNTGRLSILKKYQNNNNEKKHEYSQDKDIIQPKSAILLKRSSLIKYDDCIPFADGTEENFLKSKEIFDEKVGKPPIYSLFKTGSISSLKISSLKEQWISSEYVKSGRCKIRTQSTCNEHRCPLPDTKSNGSVDDHSSSMAVRSIGSLTTHSDLQFSVTTDKVTLASYLSKCDDRSKSAANDIMKRMDFTDMSLVASLQFFIRKIPVIGESQERDRILTYFTDRFMECNPNAFIHNDACHTLVCALMLLNTDLHGQVSKKRMTRKEFVDNILTNYPHNDYKESDLNNVYCFIRKTELKNEETTDSSNTLRRKLSKLLIKSIRPAQETNSIEIDSNLLNQQHFISGNIMRKCITRSFGKKPALGHRGWKLQFASLIGLQLLLFKTNLNKNDCKIDQEDYNGDRISLTDSNISSELLQNDDCSLSMSVHNTTTSIDSKLSSSCSRDNIQISVDDVESGIKIHHAFASIVEKLRHKNVFSLRLADESEYFFKVKSDQLLAWVNSINYAAASLSAPPIVCAGQCSHYKPLMPGYLTDFDKAKQILNHKIQISHYRESLQKMEMDNNITRARNKTNIQFCKNEIARFETYVKLLTAKSLKDLDSVPPIQQTDVYSSLSTIEPPLHDSISNQSPSARNAFHTSHITCPTDTSSQDITTLRRRPPKVPDQSFSHTISRTGTSSSKKSNPNSISQFRIVNHTNNHNHHNNPNNFSSTHDSIPPTLSTRPVVYSPQIGSHLPFKHSLTERPAPSFSRFIDPSTVSNTYTPSPPVSTMPSQPLCTQTNSDTLPDYSPPNSRHNINQV